MDLVVVGNGALGSAIAVQAAHSGAFASIAIVGPVRRTGSASLAAGMMLNAFAEVTSDTRGHAAYAEKFDVAVEALQAWPDWLKHLDEAAGVTGPRIRPGTVVLRKAHGDALDEANYAAIRDSLEARGASYERVDPSDVPGIAPSGGLRASEALFLPDEGSLDSAALLAHTDCALQALGVRLIDDRVIGLRTSGERVAGVDLERGGSLEAKTVVLANGSLAWESLAQLPDLQSRMPRVFHGIGTGLRVRIRRDFGDSTRLPNVVVRTPNLGKACGIHFVPYDADRGYLGASNAISTRPEREARGLSLHFVLDGAMKQINGHFGMASASPITGWRPTAADTFPLIGGSSLAGLWMATGTKRDGFHTSPVLAKRLVAGILGDASALNPRFAPERRPIALLSREEGIEQAVRHRMSASFQHGTVFHDSRAAETYEGALRQEVQGIYDRAGLRIGVPAEMLNMVRYGHLDPTDWDDQRVATSPAGSARSEARSEAPENARAADT